MDIALHALGIALAAIVVGVIWCVSCLQRIGDKKEALRNSELLLRPGQAVTVQLSGVTYVFPALGGDPKYSNLFGWRCWKWDIERRQLLSPSQGTLWPTPELRCASWYDDEVVGGRAGIHASLVPSDWTKHPHPVYPRNDAHVEPRQDGTLAPYIIVTGIVERFGKFVLGTEGWRAEWVIIRKLRAPTTEIGLAMEETFPDVEIIYD